MLNRIILCSAPALLMLSLGASAEHVQTNPTVTVATHVTTTQAFRDMTPVPWHNLSKVMPEHDRAPFQHVSHAPDAVAQFATLPPVGTKKGLSFDGITDNQGGGFVPPDTNSAVGLTQVVETVNVAYAVYDKTTGKLVMGPTNIQTLYTPLGGVCATANLSDPVATWDKAAQRWLITMIAFNNTFSQNASCIAVSTSSDATGTYHLYSFSYKNVLPDYPKLGVWPDAYYLTTDSFPNGGFFAGAESCALDRTNMLAGNAATSVCFQKSANDFALLPADLDGSTAPPTGAPNYEADLGVSSTILNLYKFHVDFVNTSKSTFTGPTTVTVPSYTDACGGGACIPQPPPGEILDSLAGRLMYRLAYRNFGDHEALVASHSITATVKKSLSGVRWYEIRSPGSSPALFQSGTYQSSLASLWMGSIAQDKVGDIALGFSASNGTNIKPSIAYTGRIPTDPLGQMESYAVVLQGTGVQESSSNRWGDYSSMQIDPVDDCTFWYTQEYYKTTGSFNFSTHMNSFKFTNCQ